MSTWLSLTGLGQSYYYIYIIVAVPLSVAPLPPVPRVIRVVYVYHCLMICETGPAEPGIVV